MSVKIEKAAGTGFCFGVRRVSGKDFAAHAWLEHDGAVLIGGGGLDRFVRLTSPADSPS